MAYYLELFKVQITCHNLESEIKNYQLRCTLAIVSSCGGTAIQGSAVIVGFEIKWQDQK